VVVLLTRLSVVTELPIVVYVSAAVSFLNDNVTDVSVAEAADVEDTIDMDVLARTVPARRRSPTSDSSRKNLLASIIAVSVVATEETATELITLLKSLGTSLRVNTYLHAVVVEVDP